MVMMTSKEKLIFVGSFVWLMHWGMSFITHSGYGYSEELCEDVTSWFLNNFFPRHKIEVQIEHRDLKENLFVDIAMLHRGRDPYRPRDFLIELDTYMTKSCIFKLFCMN